MCLTTVSDSGFSSESDALYPGLIKPGFPPLLTQVLGDIEFGMKTSTSSKYDMLAAVVLTPGILKRGKVLDIDHLHVSFAHAHAEILKQTAKQHEIRLKGELVSCSATSRAKRQSACTLHRTTGRTMRPMDLVHIDIVGPALCQLGDRGTSSCSLLCLALAATI